MDCVLPLEFTIPLQTVPKSGGVGSSSSSPTILATLRSIFRNEGIAGLYAGLRPTLVMSVPNTVLYFTTYDEISMRLRRQYQHSNLHHLAIGSNSGSWGRDDPIEKQFITDKEASTATSNDNDNHPAFIPLVAGSTARLVATMVTAPLELIRTRQASVVATATATTREGGTSSGSVRSSSVVIPGMIDELKYLTRTRGISSLYAGLAPTLWRDVPFSALYWLFFERCRNALSNNDDDLLGRWGGRYYLEKGMKLPPGIEAMHAFIAGAAAGSIAAAFTT